MSYRLQQTPQHLQLEFPAQPELKPIVVDFTVGSNYHRYRYGGGRGQLIARACGLHKQKQLRIIDATAGLGTDAFILASLGAEVTMLERSEILAVLLRDGLQRARQHEWFATLSLELIEADACEYLRKLDVANYPDVIYCDPMYPHSDKSALARKEMRVLRNVVGNDNDAGQLLKIALQRARKRVVVKRPRLAATVSEQKPDLVCAGKSSRFDVYLK